jgi:hypothetical protein
MIPQETAHERLRQPMSNISMAAQNITLYLESIPMTDRTINTLVEIITTNIQRLDQELAEVLKELGNT